MESRLTAIISRLYEICEEMDDSGFDVGQGHDTKLMLISDFFDYITFLSSSDGVINLFETDFLKKYFLIKKVPMELDFRAKHMDDRFKLTIPETLRKFTSYDNYLYSKDHNLNISNSLALIDAYEILGKEFLVCDGEATAEEVDDYTAYISMLKAYWKNAYTGSIHPVSTIDSRINCSNSKSDDGSLDELLEELNSLIGLTNVKYDLTKLIHLQEIQRIRKLRGLNEIPVTNHLVFSGNPGTGKTTVARLLAKIYYKMGILSKGTFVEVDRAGLVADYVGQTAGKTKEVINSALGGVLFIDEAYMLTSYKQGEGDFGKEAVDTLLKAMEDNRDDFIVIVAGYPKHMTQFIDSNPGLRSRFNKYISFEDYSPDELIRIFDGICAKNNYRCEPGAHEYVVSRLTEKYNARTENFANAREVRNMFETAILNQADRLYGISSPTDEQLCTLVVEDLK